MKKIILLFALMGYANADAQTTIIWEKNYGGSDYEFGEAALPTADGGYVLGGGTYSSANGDVSSTSKGGQDAWVIKTDNAGGITWQKNYGGSGTDYLTDIQKTSDGGYIFVGATTSSANGDVTGASKGGNDFWIVKLTATGAISWQKNYGGSSAEYGYSIQQTSDGGYIVGGVTSSTASGDMTGASKGNADAWILKLTSTGAITWQKNYGGSATERVYAVKQTADGGYIFCGLTSSSANGDVTGVSKGATDAWVVKLTSTGAISWQKNLGGIGNESPYDIIQTSEGGYVLSGVTSSSATGDVTGTSNGGDDAWIVKLTSTGAISWEKNLGGNAGEYAYTIQQNTDGNYLVSGLSSSSVSGDFAGISKGASDVWIFKLNATGTLVWEKNYGGAGADEAKSIQETSDGNYMVAGTTASSESGDVSAANKGLYDFWLIKIGASTTLGTSAFSKNDVVVSPNPAKDFAVLSNLPKAADISIFDMSGKVIFETKTMGSTLTLNTSSYKPGVYLINVNGQVLKLLKQ